MPNMDRRSVLRLGVTGAVGAYAMNALGIPGASAESSAEAGSTVNVVEQGVSNTGAEDVRAAIQAVVKEFGGQHPIRFPRGRYRIGESGQSGSNRIVLPSGTRIECDPGAVFEVNAVDAQRGTAVFYASGTEGSKRVLTVPQPEGSQFITLPPEFRDAFKTGDLIGLESTRQAVEIVGYRDPGLGIGFCREIRQVSTVEGDVVHVDTPLEYTYLPEDNARFFRVTPVTDIALTGLRFESGPGVTPGVSHTYAIKLEKSLGVQLRDIELHNMTGGVILLDAYHAGVDGLLADGLPSVENSYGYGLAAAGSTTHLVANHLSGQGTRHIFTTLADERPGKEYWGGPMHVEVNDSTGTGGSDSYSVFDTHEFGRHIHFNNCTALGGGPKVCGYQMRAQHVVLNNCRAEGNGLHAVSLKSTSANVVIEGGEFAKAGYAGVNVRGRDHRIDGARVANSGQSGTASGGIDYAGSVDVHIKGCQLVDNFDRGLKDSGIDPSVRAFIEDCVALPSATQTMSIFRANDTTTLKDCEFGP